MIILIQNFLSVSKYNTTIWAQVPLRTERTERFYREKCWFLQVLNDVQLPKFVTTHSIRKRAEVLFYYHSSGLVKDACRLSMFSVETTLDDLIPYSMKMLDSSYGMPSKKFTPNIELSQFENLHRVIRGGDDPWYEIELPDEKDFKASKTNPYHASDKKLQALLEILSTNEKLVKFDVCDLGSGSADFLPQQSSKAEEDHKKKISEDFDENDYLERLCGYICLSQAIFNETFYYSRLRVAVAHILTMWSFFLPTTLF